MADDYGSSIATTGRLSVEKSGSGPAAFPPILAATTSRPDLVIDDVEVDGKAIGNGRTVSKKFAPGDTVSLDWDVRNIGDGDAGSSRVVINLFRNGMSDEVDDNPTSAIEAGRSDSGESDSFVLPENLAPGRYGVQIFADGGGEVTEENENNNSYSFFIDVVAAQTVYTLTPSTSTVTEGGQLTFTVTRSGDKPAETVYFSTLSDGTATYGEGDYTTTSGGSPANIAVNFSSGETSETVTLNIRNDGVSDSGEQFRSIIQRNSSDSASTYLSRSAYVTINDFAQQGTSYSLTPSSTSVTEGGQVTFTITRSGDKPTETVYFSTLSDGTATFGEGDYTTTSGGMPSNIAVSFSSGETSETVTVNIRNDGVSDTGEQFRAIVQRNSSDGVSAYLDRSAYVTINDAGQQGTSYSLTPSSTSTTEGGQITFTVTRSGDKPTETVYFSTLSDGTATYGEGDYATTSGGSPTNIAVNFSSGETSETVTLNIRNEGESDSGEQFRAIVQRDSSDSASTYLGRSAYITINDAPVLNTSYSLTPSSRTATEGAQVTFTITRASNLPAQTVYFSTLSDGTASYGEGDYTTTSGGAPANIGVYFSSGDTSETVTLNIRNDGVSDTGEEFRAIIQENSSSGAATFLARSSYVSISDIARAVDPGVEEGWQDGVANYLPSFVNVARAETGSSTYLAGFRYPVSSSGVATERDTDDDLWYSTQDLGTRYRPENPLHDHSYYHLGEDWNYSQVASETSQYAYAVWSGTVAFKEVEHKGFGNVIVIRHPLPDGDVVYSLYSHLGGFFKGFKVGDKVSSGDPLGTLGSSGPPGTPVHLHFEIFSMEAGKSVEDYLVTGLNLHYGYSHNLSGTFGETSASITDYRSYTEGGFTWYNPSIFIDAHKDFAVVSNEDRPTEASVYSRGSSAVIEFFGEAKEVVTNWFEEIHLIGDSLADRWIIKPLFGTTIDDNTVYVDGGGGDDIVDGATADRRLVLEGGTGADRLSGGTGSDLLDGGEGEDLLDGGFGADTMRGGLHNDAYVIDNARDVVAEGGTGGTDEIRTTLASFSLASVANIENLIGIGTAGQSLTGSNGANVIRGSSGNDVIRGLGAADILSGGAGNDAFYVETLDTVSEAAGGGYDRVITSNSFSLALGAEIEVLQTDNVAGTIGYILRGSDTANIISGNAGRNLLVGNGGNDTLYGNGGDDRLEGGAGLDTLIGGGGADSLFGGAGNDIFYVEKLDAVLEAVGGGYDEVRSANDFTLAAGAEIEVLQTDHLASTAGYILRGNEFANLIRGNAGRNLLVGNDGNDTLYGYSGDDRLEGGRGRDALLGEDGNDILRGQEDDDRLDGGAGNDRLEGDGGNDLLIGGAGIEVMFGGTGDDIFYVDKLDTVSEAVGGGYDEVRSSNDFTLAAGAEIEVLQTDNLAGTVGYILRGNEFANLIRGNAGRNLLVGNDGNDTLYAYSGDDRVEGGRGRDALFGEAGNDILRGQEDDDRIDGGAGNDQLYGDGGNDMLIGGSGIETMFGGTGNDVFYVDRLDSVTEAAGGGHDDVRTSNDFTLAAGAEIEVLQTDNVAGTGGYILRGNEFANTIRGNAGRNLLAGNDGNDALYAYAGDDRVEGGTGNDSVYSGLGNDLVYGQGGNDYARGELGNDRLEGGAGEDTLLGDAGDDHILGGNDNDNLLGNDGADLIGGGTGDDRLDGGTGEDRLHGEAGNDSIRGSAGRDMIYGQDGNDILRGDGDDDHLEGGSGNDQLHGDAGSDVVFGGGGADLLYGQSGADRFRFTAASDSAPGAADRIFDFDRVGGDKIDLSGIDANGALAGEGAFTFVGTAPFSKVAGQLRYEIVSNQLHVHGDVDGDGVADFSFLVNGGSMQSADFIL